MYNQEKLFACMQADLLNRDGPCTLYGLSDHWVLVTSKYDAYVLPRTYLDTCCTGTKWTEDSTVHRRIDNTLNGSDLFYVGKMKVSVNMLKYNSLVFKDDFGLFYLIRSTDTAEYLVKYPKCRRIKRYQDMIVFWSPDDDFPIYAACEINGQQVKGV